MKRKINNKKGVSEMISYVILVAITIAISFGVYSWLKYQIPSCSENDIDCFSPIDCPDGTSIMINNYICDSLGITITLENNGRFNITGIIMAVAEDETSIPGEYLFPVGSKTAIPGEFIFLNPLKPNEEINIRYSKKSKKGDLSGIAMIKMQIFTDTTNRKICKNIVIRQPLKDCSMDPIDN